MSHLKRRLAFLLVAPAVAAVPIWIMAVEKPTADATAATPAAQPAASKTPADPAATNDTTKDPSAKANAIVERGINYLRSQQKADGGWATEKQPPAITAIVLKAIVQAPEYNSKTDFVAKGYQKLLGFQLDNGGIYQDMLANYNTSIAVSALAAADDPAFKPRLDKAVAYLKGLQWSDRTGVVGPKGEKVADPSNTWFGRHRLWSSWPAGRVQYADGARSVARCRFEARRSCVQGCADLHHSDAESKREQRSGLGDRRRRLRIHACQQGRIRSRRIFGP